MYQVKLYNKISKVGLENLDATKYTCSSASRARARA